jgi:hypothetical protein
MPNLSEISTGTKLLLGAGILLLIDSFLPWQEVDVLGVEVASRNAWHGWGILMIIALVALLAWVVIQVMNVKLNFELPITESWLTLGLGVAVLVFALLKLITDDFRAWAAFVGVALAALVAVGAWLRAQELGGVSFERTGEGVPRTDDADTTMRTSDTDMMGRSEPESMPPTTPPESEPPPRPPSSSSTDV